LAPGLTILTGTDGLAAATITADTVATPVTITASIPGTAVAPVVFTAAVRPGAASQLVILRQPSTFAQATLPFGTQPLVQVADRFGNAVAKAGLAVDATASCARCARIVPRATAPSLSRSSAIARTQAVADTFPRGVAGTVEVVTDANGSATFTDLALSESVGSWALQFFAATEPLSGVVSNVIQLSAGPAASVIAWSVSDTTFISVAGDTLFPSIRLIDKVGNGIPDMSVSWDVADTLSAIAGQGSMSTKTDASGVAAAGPWTTAAGASAFSIRATVNSGPKIENSPLTLWAFVGVPAGRFVRPTGTAKIRN
jgi:hypothetical protein